MDRRIPSIFGSTLLLLGAFVVGGILHRVLVKGTLGATSPASVFSLLFGGVLIYVGWRLENEFDPSAMVPDDTDEEDEEEFDESLSPIDESQLEDLERDDSYEE